MSSTSRNCIRSFVTSIIIIIIWYWCRITIISCTDGRWKYIGNNNNYCGYYVPVNYYANVKRERERRSEKSLEFSSSCSENICAKKKIHRIQSTLISGFIWRMQIRRSGESHCNLVNIVVLRTRQWNKTVAMHFLFSSELGRIYYCYYCFGTSWNGIVYGRTTKINR